MSKILGDYCVVCPPRRHEAVRAGRVVDAFTYQNCYLICPCTGAQLCVLFAVVSRFISTRHPAHKNNSAGYQPDSCGSALCSCSLLLTSQHALVSLHSTAMVLAAGHFLPGGARPRYGECTKAILYKKSIIISCPFIYMFYTRYICTSIVCHFSFYSSTSSTPRARADSSFQRYRLLQSQNYDRY